VVNSFGGDVLKGATMIGHLDADCFYVSAERVRCPQLIGKPVGVLGNQGACVIAKSYEMKKAGVSTGEPIWDARKKCPDGVYLKRDFRWYEVLSRGMLEAVESFSPSVEYYSIDEFFFQVLERGASAQTTADAMRERIFQKLSLPVTIGIARTRTLAKLFSDTAKPFGARAVLGREAEREELAKLAVTEISGIARRRALRLEPYRIFTCLDLADADRLLIRRVLTRTGEAIWYELNGQPVTAINTRRTAHQALSRGGSLGGATADPMKIYAWLVRNLERLIEELEFHQVRTGLLELWLGYKEGSTGVGRVAIDTPSATRKVRPAWAASRLIRHRIDLTNFST
jgi:DNA polymerase V